METRNYCLSVCACVRACVRACVYISRKHLTYAARSAITPTQAIRTSLPHDDLAFVRPPSTNQRYCPRLHVYEFVLSSVAINTRTYVRTHANTRTHTHARLSYPKPRHRPAHDSDSHQTPVVHIPLTSNLLMNRPDGPVKTFVLPRRDRFLASQPKEVFQRIT